MNDDDLKHLLRDVVEDDTAYRRARESAWERVRADMQPAHRGRIIAWGLVATAAAVAILLGGISFHSHQKASLSLASLPAPPPPAMLVEIVSTRDLPPAYVEIDGPTLRRLFPQGLVIAYGQNPQVFTFDRAGSSPPSD